MRLHGGSSAAMRQHFLRWYFQPRAALMLTVPWVRSVTLAVSQYWDDEAHDAVHIDILPSAERDPGWPIRERTLPWQERPGIPHDLTAGLPDFYGDNYDLIVAFGAYCPTGGDQNHTIEENARPYAIARQGGQGVTVEVVGKVHQPEWEDRFFRPSKARFLNPPPTLPLAERARRGEPLTAEILLAALDGEAVLGEACGVAARLSDAAERWVSGGKRDEAVLREVQAWLAAWGA
jgi:hypothetical protein